MFLEKQMRNVDGIVSGFEEKLAKDGAILDQPNALQSRNTQLQVLYFIMQQTQVFSNFRICSYEEIQTLSPSSLFFLLMPNRPCVRMSPQRRTS